MLLRAIGSTDVGVVEQFAPLASRRDPTKYCLGWGRPGDLGVVAMEGTTTVGAAWTRLFAEASPPAEPDIPELAIAVYAEHRGRGAGRALLDRLFVLLAAGGHACVDLSVASDNTAARGLYDRVGFVEVERAADGRLWMRRRVI